MSGFFSTVKSMVVIAATASKTAVVYTYNTAKKSLVPIYLYISAADLSALFQSAYKSGLSPSTRQKLFYVAMNLITFVTIDNNSSAKDIAAGKANVFLYTPTAAGLVVKHFTRSYKKKEKLAVTLSNNALLKTSITENVGVFDPKVVLLRSSTALISRDPLEDARAEQLVLFNTLKRMRIWHQVFKKAPGDSPEWGNRELPSCREVTEQPSQEDGGLLGERLAAISENE